MLGEVWDGEVWGIGGFDGGESRKLGGSMGGLVLLVSWKEPRNPDF